MKSKKFYDVKHANSYLANSIISRAGRPIMIDGVTGTRSSGRMRATYRHLADPTNSKVAYLPDKAMDLTPIPLGMWYWKHRGYHRAFYVSRYPVRMWKIGLASRNISVQAAVYKHGGLAIGLDDVIWSYEFEKMVKGDYPDLNKALGFMRKKPENEIPISRRFAISDNGLYYKAMDEPVGTLTDNGFELVEDFDYLQQVMQEDLGDACA